MGISELLFIFFIALVLFKPDKLGEYIVKFQGAMKQVNEVKESITEEVKPLADIYEETKEQVNDIKKI